MQKSALRTIVSVRSRGKSSLPSTTPSMSNPIDKQPGHKLILDGLLWGLVAQSPFQKVGREAPHLVEGVLGRRWASNPNKSPSKNKFVAKLLVDKVTYLTGFDSSATKTGGCQSVVPTRAPHQRSALGLHGRSAWDVLLTIARFQKN